MMAMVVADEHVVLHRHLDCPELSTLWLVGLTVPCLTVCRVGGAGGWVECPSVYVFMHMPGGIP